LSTAGNNGFGTAVGKGGSDREVSPKSPGAMKDVV